MEINEIVLAFFGGSGLVGLLTYFLNKDKLSLDKEAQMIDRLLKEIERLDELVIELRMALNDRTELYTDARKSLMHEQQRNNDLEILVARLEAEIIELKRYVKSINKEAFEDE